MCREREKGRGERQKKTETEREKEMLNNPDKSVIYHYFVYA